MYTVWSNQIGTVRKRTLFINLHSTTYEQNNSTSSGQIITFGRHKYGRIRFSEFRRYHCFWSSSLAKNCQFSNCSHLIASHCTIGCPKMHLFPWNIPWPRAKESVSDVRFENIFVFRFCSMHNVFFGFGFWALLAWIVDEIENSKSKNIL